MDKYGLNPNPTVPAIPQAEKFLISCFRREWPDLLILAAMDDTKRRNLSFILNYPDISPWGGEVNYCKKNKQFDFIEYSSKGYAKRIDILNIPMTETNAEIPKRKQHSHFWIEEGILYESYFTLRGMRYQGVREVDLPDTDLCNEEMLRYICAEYY